MEDRPRPLTTTEVAKRCQVKVPTVRRWIRTGALPAENVGTEAKPQYLVHLADLDRALRGSVEPPEEQGTTKGES